MDFALKYPATQTVLSATPISPTPEIYIKCHQPQRLLMKDIISMGDFSKEEIVYVLDAADDVKKAIHHEPFNTTTFQAKYGTKVEHLLSGVKVATLFIENSTRTHHSFKAAVMKAGGAFDGFPSAEYTSLKKGETWADTAAMFSGYGYQALIMRSTTEGLPRWTKESLEQSHQLLQMQHRNLGVPFSYKVPLIINGGDGKNQHPTQCFLDLFTMREIARAHGKDLDGLSLALLNDLAHGRTNASLMSIAHLFSFKLHLAYPQRFGPPAHRLESLKRNGVEVIDHRENFFEAMRASFIAYHSRPQKERVGQGEDLLTIKKLGQITKGMYDSLGEYAPFLLHPLPVDAETFEEIAADMKLHPKNITKLQSSNGLYVRIALLALGLNRMNGRAELFQTEEEKLDFSLEELNLSDGTKELNNPRSGYIEQDGLVLDHLPAGMGRRLAGVLGLEKEKFPKVISDYLPSKSGYKDMIKIHSAYELSEKQYRAIALIAPNATISYVKNEKVIRKVRPVIGNWLIDRVRCGNGSCVSNVVKEHVKPKHRVEQFGSELILECNYCEQTDRIPKIYDENRFIYL